MSLRHVKIKEMLPCIAGIKRWKSVLLRGGIDLKGNRIMKNKLLVVSLLRKARKSEFAKLKLCKNDHRNHSYHLLNPYCGQYFMLIIIQPVK